MWAGVAQLVERILAKDEVAGPNPVSRSKKMPQRQLGLFFWRKSRKRFVIPPCPSELRQLAEA